ncbi:helix-turn-helix transcriptional regulator [Bradyrhizobium sp. INPA01-394B]|uniref:Helix-turn-helix transcriptional regulator n=1 Tax=Bradyrhizobium campsiandrae TaxID=1729892 RepID=A0ABR7U578_9BRAD|nr:LuxR C-terminal-related transcriptional regulator [Bradyrhizobium campsiandrae]MBC9882884.1 helix-turn-helix transcriptional regulator [Bradyrhizobium campsiandrae]MBC9979204.1 helix-turn-helix transcriptional regulator [Bradyrhizobium campsiandrae]
MTSEAARLSELIGLIYDAALDPALWPHALGQACLFVGGSSGALFWHDAATEESAALHMFNEDPHYTQLYFEKYLPLNPCFPAGAFIEAGVVWGSTDLIPFEEIVETRFYAEWMKPQGIIDALGTNLEKSATSASVLAVRMHEEDGLADADDRRRLGLLVPHFQRAVAIGRLFDQGRTSQAVLTETLDHVSAAVFLVGPAGRLVFTNQPARLMLDEAVLVGERNGALMALSPEAHRALRDALLAAENGNATADRGGSIPIVNSHGRWFADVLPLTSGDRQRAGALHSAVAAVFVRKTSLASPPPLEALARMYKLTASEIRVLDAVMKVSGVRALAEALGLTQATVKTHLHNVFRKTGTARQSELVKLVAGFAPPEHG